jgi:hypothetical protein
MGRLCGEPLKRFEMEAATTSQGVHDPNMIRSRVELARTDEAGSEHNWTNARAKFLDIRDHEKFLLPIRDVLRDCSLGTSEAVRTDS